MKKFICIFLVLCSFSLFCAENGELTVSSANKKTAIRCLQLSQTYILNNNYKAAYEQAVLGLTYDSSISDLIYIKASCMKHLSYKNADILQTIKLSLEQDTWVNNNKNNARILYADILSETGNADLALQVLNEAPLIYTADAEIIRIKSLYRMGTSSSINQAREKVDTSRRIYSKDERFPYLFFMFETLFYENAMLNGIDYQVPPKVSKIALDYIVKLPDYKTNKIEMEIMASLFAPPEYKTRLLRATGQKTNQNSLYALASLKAGILSQKNAFDLFFENLGENVNLSTLEAFVSLIDEPELKEQLKIHLQAFEGKVFVDDNLDLINEMEITYERGRAQYIKYDQNNDGIFEITAALDFGTPLMVYLEPEGFEVHYGIYPYVENIKHEEGNALFDFVGADFYYSPFDMRLDNVFKTLDIDFYIPYVTDEYTCPELSYMLLNCSHLKIQTQERPASQADYALVAGKIHSITFYDENQNAYAWAVTQDMFPFTRYVDYDADGILETSEIYSLDENNLYQTNEDKELLYKIFGLVDFGQNFYLSQIKIDRNNDGIFEYQESFLENNGKVSSWDNDGNGIIDYEYIRHPQKEGDDLIEETVFYNSNGVEYVTVQNKNNLPIKVFVNKNEKLVIKGKSENIYWIEKSENTSIERQIVIETQNHLTVGAVTLVDLKNNGRYSVIKVGKDIFIKRLSSSDLDLNIMQMEVK